MKLAIMQPYFFPYLGYFQLINAADRFVLLDEVQYIRHGWINRNRILKPQTGVQYINVPLKKHHQKNKISEISITAGGEWKTKIIRQLEHYKSSAPYYQQTIDFLKDCFTEEEQNLAKLNALMLKRILKHFDMAKNVELASTLPLDYAAITEKDDWALNISKQLQASEYINPVGGQLLFQKKKFADQNIRLRFLEPGIKPYSQGRRLFEPALSIIDVMMFNSVATIKNMLNDYRFV